MDNWWKRNLTSPIIRFWGQKKETKRFPKAPILIGGCARTGTSLLLSMLSAHPYIHAFAHEVDAFTAWKDIEGRTIPLRHDRLYRAMLKDKVSVSARRWCEKRPANCRFVDEILRFYGAEARIILLVRDPRAVCTSHHPENPSAYWVSIDRWVNDTTATIFHNQKEQVMIVKYEDLVNDSEKQLEAICQFIEEPCSQEISRWFDNATVRENRAWFGNLQQVKKNSLTKWKEPVHAERIKSIRSDDRVNHLAIKLGYWQ
ncbi:MAG: sulfotransferase [Cyclobacteriaceae bacterium]